MNTLQDHSEANLDRLKVVLDEAINQLASDDRAAILLRFFEQRSLRSVGEALGSNEDAAQKRVTRALEKLQLTLKRRGLAFSTVALGTTLAAQAVTAAPATLAATVSIGALASAAGGGSTFTLIKLVSMTKLHAGIVGGVIVAGIATSLLVPHQLELSRENASLRQQNDQLKQLAAENQGDSSRPAPASAAEPLSQEQLSELLKLRGEVARLRSQQAAGAPPESKGAAKDAPRPAAARVADAIELRQYTGPLKAPTVNLVAKADWSNAGTATPSAAFQTFDWALANHDVNAFAQTVAWDPYFKTEAEALLAVAPEAVRKKFSSVDDILYALLSSPKFGQSVSSFALVSEDIRGDEGMIFEQHQFSDGRTWQSSWPMQRYDDGWRVVFGQRLRTEIRDILANPEILNAPAAN